MFAKVAVFVATFGALASAWTTVSSVAPPTATTISQCNTGAASCCNVAGAASSIPATVLDPVLALVEVVLTDTSVIVGVACSVIDVGDSCDAQPVCCTDNQFNGLINIGCTPITL